MDELGCETGVFASDMEVVACPNGDRLATGDALAPPTARTFASNARRSDSDMPIVVLNTSSVSATLPSSVGGGSSLDPVDTVVKDVAAREPRVYGEEEVGERVNLEVKGFVLVARLGTSPALPRRGSRRCQPSMSRRPR